MSSYNSKYTGAEVEALLDKVKEGSAYDVTDVLQSSTITSSQFEILKEAVISKKTIYYSYYSDSGAYFFLTPMFNSITNELVLWLFMDYGEGDRFISIYTINGNNLTISLSSADIPSNTSQLTNDSGYVTDSELEAKGYLTEHQDISGKEDKYTSELSSSGTVVLSDTKMLILGEQSAVTITLPSGAESNGREYLCQFTASASGCTLSVPDTITWLGGETPTINAGKTYQLSIVNNLAVIGEF